MDEQKPKNMLSIWPDWTPKVLAYMTTLGFFSALGGLYFVAIPTSNREPILLLLGTVGTAWLMVMGYYYVQSAGSVSRQAVKANSEAQVIAATKVTTQETKTQETKAS